MNSERSCPCTQTQRENLILKEHSVLNTCVCLSGQFPSSFVEIVTIPSLKEGESLFVCTCEFTSQELNSLSLHRGVQMPVNVRRGHRFLDTEAKEVVSHSLWILGTELWPSA